MDIIYKQFTDSRVTDFIDKGFENYADEKGVVCDYQPFVFEACDGDRLLGVIIGNSYYNVVHIRNLIVSKDCRHMNIGTALISAVEEHCKGKGFDTIELTTYAFQAPGFYQKCGFDVEYIRRSKSDSRLDKYFMVKYL